MLHIRISRRARDPVRVAASGDQDMSGLIAQAEAKANLAIRLQQQARDTVDPVKRARLLAQAEGIYAQCDRLAERANRQQQRKSK